MNEGDRAGGQPRRDPVARPRRGADPLDQLRARPERRRRSRSCSRAIAVAALDPLLPPRSAGRRIRSTTSRSPLAAARSGSPRARGSSSSARSMGAMFIGQQFLQNVLGYSTLDAGPRSCPAALFMVLVAPRSAKLVEAHGARVTLLLGYVFVLLGVRLGMLVLWKEDISYWKVGARVCVRRDRGRARGDAGVAFAHRVGARDAGRDGVGHGRPPARPRRGDHAVDLRRAPHGGLRRGDGRCDRRLRQARHRLDAGAAQPSRSTSAEASPRSIRSNRARSSPRRRRRSCRATSGRTLAGIVAVLVGCGGRLLLVPEAGRRAEAPAPRTTPRTRASRSARSRANRPSSRCKLRLELFRSSPSHRRCDDMSDDVDRTTLPIRRPPFAGVTNEGPSRARSPTGTRPCTSRLRRAPRTSCSSSSTTPASATRARSAGRSTRRTTRAWPTEGLRYNRFHVTAVCSPTRAAMLTGRNQHRVGLRPRRRVLGPVPRLQRRPSRATARRSPRILQENGYMTAAHRQVAPDAGQPAGLERAVRPLADRARVRLLLGLPRRRGGPVRPARSPRTRRSIGVPEGKDGKPYYFPDDMADKAIDWLHRVRAEQPATPWFMYYATGCSHAPHHVPREWSDKYKGKFDQGWDVAARGDARAPEGARRRPGRHGAAAQNDGVPDMGLADRDRASACTRARWRSTPATPRTPTGTSAASSTRSRRWASSTTRS